MKIKKRIFIVGIVTVMLISCLMPQSVHAYTGIELVAKDSTLIYSGVDGFEYIAPVGTEINLKYRGVGQNHEWSTAPSYTGTLPDGLSLVPEESQEEPFFYIKGTVVNATSGDLKATLNFTSIDNVTATSDMSFKVDKARPTISGSNILDRASGLKSSMTVDVTIANAYFGGSTPVMTSWRAKIRTGSGQDVWSDYSTATDSNVSFTFPADQLNLLPVGGPYDIYAIFEGNDNNWGLPFTKIGTFTVTAPIDASVTSATANFDKYAPADVIITKNDGSYTLASVKNGTATLVSGTDYTINGDTITVGKDYLSSLPNGNATLTFDYGMSTNPTVDITVADSTPTRNIHMTQSTGGTVAVSPESGKVGDTITVTATPDSGYYLKNIMVDGQAITGTTFVMKDADAEVSADFRIYTYDIKASASPTAGGTITGTGTVEYGKDVTLEAKAASGYTFSKWTENGKDVGKEAKLTIKDVQANQSYVAVFTKNTTTTKTNTTNGNTTNKTTVVTTTAAKTGDETNLMLYCMLMILAVGTMITMIAIRKRRAR